MYKERIFKIIVPEWVTPTGSGSISTNTESGVTTLDTVIPGLEVLKPDPEP